MFKWQFFRNGQKYWQFFFGQVHVFYFLVQFEDDPMRPNESTKNGRKGAHGLNCKIFVNSEAISEVYDKKVT